MKRKANKIFDFCKVSTYCILRRTNKVIRKINEKRTKKEETIRNLQQ